MEFINNSDEYQSHNFQSDNYMLYIRGL